MRPPDSRGRHRGRGRQQPGKSIPLLVALLLVPACAATRGNPGRLVERAQVPTAPASNDPSFTYSGLKRYYTIGNALTPGEDTLTLTVSQPGADRRADALEAWIDGSGRRPLNRAADGRLSLVADVSSLGPGRHEVLVAAEGSGTALARLTFYRTHPLYVVVSSDWDDADMPEESLPLQEALHRKHPALVVTHFVGPYTFTDPMVSEGRRAFLADWVARMRNTFGDEIGVHVHPWCHFVQVTGVPCRATPSTVQPDGDPTGYSVVVASYSEREFVAMLDAAKQAFAARGLGTPTSFRAGGWTLGLDTMRALAATGFVADSSAVNWKRLAPEWEGSDLYAWNKSQWAPIGDTSQPWYPSLTNLLGRTAPVIPILEVPDNGILADYITAGEMIDVFTKNWTFRPGALVEPRQLSIGYHPTTFAQADFEARLDSALNHIDRYLARNGDGPVVYARLSDLTKVWSAPGRPTTVRDTAPAAR